MKSTPCATTPAAIDCAICDVSVDTLSEWGRLPYITMKNNTLISAVEVKGALGLPPQSCETAEQLERTATRSPYASEVDGIKCLFYTEYARHRRGRAEGNENYLSEIETDDDAHTIGWRE